MSGVTVAYDPCPCCQSNLLFGDHNCNTGEHTYQCIACGSHEKLQFRRSAGKRLYREIAIPLEQVVLTVRINNSKGAVMPVVWEAEIPAQADTNFIYLFLNHKKEEINAQYPGFPFPDLGAIERQFDAYAFCAVEQRLQHPSRKDNLPYIRRSYIGNQFEIRRSSNGDELIVLKQKYTAKSGVGGGVIAIMDIQGSTQFWRTFPPGTTVRRAQRLWAAHVNANTDVQKSYMTLMQNGTLRVLQGALPVPEDD